MTLRQFDARQPYSPAELAASYCRPGGALVVVGPTGSGKSTLLAAMADALVARDRQVVGICADPGSPAFGTPGALGRARRQPGRGGAAAAEWRVEALAGLATLDAMRFRLPLISAARRLRREVASPDAVVLVDAPGVWRGRGAQELLVGLVDAVDADAVLALTDGDQGSEPLAVLAACGVHLVQVEPPARASAGSRNQRVASRTDAWRGYLDGAESLALPKTLRRLGTPPPWEAGSAWPGRQVALVDANGATLAMGEVESVDDAQIHLRAPASVSGDEIAALVVRDARSDADGLLRTDQHRAAPQKFLGARETAIRLSPPFTARGRPYIEIDPGGAMSAQISFASATVVGGLFDDPTVYARLRHASRGLLFDLGAVGRLPAKLLHRVTDAFVSHAHFDHFAGFVELLRRRVHMTEVCRVWGPMGLADQVEAMGRAFTWDRIGPGEGPVFVVGEVAQGQVRKTRLEPAANGREEICVEPLEDGLLLVEPRFQVRTCALEHGTTVLAYALEETRRFEVRSDRLEGKYAPGAWLGELKNRAACGQWHADVELGDGSVEKVGALAEHLLIEKAGEKIVYATDFADTDENRRRVVDLARGASVLICESSFREEDRQLAAYSRHLTTRACADIAREARVQRLVPFHFSARYESAPETVYAEILARFDDVIVPDEVARKLD